MSNEGYITLFLVQCVGIWAMTREEDGLRLTGYFLLAIVGLFLILGIVGNG